jgi:YfiH family protein
MNLITPEWDAPPGVRALCTMRSGGVSLGRYDDGSGSGGLNLGLHVGDHPEHVEENRSRLQASLPGRPTWLEQVHGAEVVLASSAELSPRPDAAPGPAPRADASVAVTTGAVCAIQTADCLPVLFCDARGTVVGAAHGGWRGLAAGVLDNTVAAMRGQGAEDILAWLGPAIGPARFEVGEEVLQAFARIDAAMQTAFVPVPDRPGKYLADIYRLARLQLAALGVDRVSGGGFCTVTESRHFYSYRRDGVTGRMASLVWLG